MTIWLIGAGNRTPETVFGAMAASFTVIGTLVGTYFGIKAGLDGQDKVKDSVGRANGESGERPPTRAQGDEDRTDGKLQVDGRNETLVVERSDPEEQQKWEKVGV